MIYELRSYDINPNRWEEYGKWAQELAFPLFFEHFKLPLVGFWETLPVEDTPYDSFNTTVGVHWILAWESVEARHRRWAELDATEELQELVRKARDEDGNPLFHMRIQMTMLKPWPGSPLQ